MATSPPSQRGRQLFLRRVLLLPLAQPSTQLLHALAVILFLHRRAPRLAANLLVPAIEHALGDPHALGDLAGAPGVSVLQEPDGVSLVLLCVPLAVAHG